MQHHYSTVSSDERRTSIGKLSQLFGNGGTNSSAGRVSGPLNEKTGRFAGSNRLIQFRFCGAGEGIRILRSEPANDETAVFKPLGEIKNPVSTTLARPQDDSGTFHRRLLEVNEHRLKRLERLAALDRSVRPALAAARALEAAYAHDDVASEAAMEDMARALSGAE